MEPLFKLFLGLSAFAVVTVIDGLVGVYIARQKNRSPHEGFLFASILGAYRDDHRGRTTYAKESHEETNPDRGVLPGAHGRRPARGPSLRLSHAAVSVLYEGDRAKIRGRESIFWPIVRAEDSHSRADSQENDSGPLIFMDGLWLSGCQSDYREIMP